MYYIFLLVADALVQEYLKVIQMFVLLLIILTNFKSLCLSHSVCYIDIGRCGVSANETTLHPNNNFKKVNHYRSMYGLQHGALAHTEQQAIKGPKITSVKPFKRENERSLEV